MVCHLAVGYGRMAPIVQLAGGRQYKCDDGQGRVMRGGAGQCRAGQQGAEDDRVGQDRAQLGWLH